MGRRENIFLPWMDFVAEDSRGFGEDSIRPWATICQAALRGAAAHSAAVRSTGTQLGVTPAPVRHECEVPSPDEKPRSRYIPRVTGRPCRPLNSRRFFRQKSEGLRRLNDISDAAKNDLFQPHQLYQSWRPVVARPVLFLIVNQGRCRYGADSGVAG
jgi:hypothetical protein